MRKRHRRHWTYSRHNQVNEVQSIANKAHIHTEEFYQPLPPFTNLIYEKFLGGNELFDTIIVIKKLLLGVRVQATTMMLV